MLQKLLKDPVIQQCRLKRDETDLGDNFITNVTDKKAVPSFGAKAAGAAPAPGTDTTDKPAEGATTTVPDDITNFYDKIDNEEDEDEANLKTVSFEVNQEKIEVLQKRCIEIEHPLLAEYDFRNDTINPDINIDLKPAAVLRPYQEKSLRKMFGNGRARSGVIVLPCGAGRVECFNKLPDFPTTLQLMPTPSNQTIFQENPLLASRPVVLFENERSSSATVACPLNSGSNNLKCGRPPTTA